MLTVAANNARLVQELRKRTGLTQERFAARLGVTCPTINRWENGHVSPSPLALKQIEALARELGPEAQDLLLEYFPEESHA
jgi:DNA-binding transcriptional regulator YiaG